MDAVVEVSPDAPMKVLHYSENDGRNGYGLAKQIYVVECPPTRIYTRMRDYYAEGRGGGDLDLPMPWHYYVVSFFEHREDNKEEYKKRFGYLPTAMGPRVASVFGRPGRLERPTDDLYYLPLPNFYPTSLTFCGISHGLTLDEDLPLEAKINAAIAAMWGANFSYINSTGRWAPVWDKFAADAQAAKGNYGRYSMRDLYRYWESLSTDDILKFPWGMLSIGSLETLIRSQYFAYDSYA